jgi:hypothetical protein
MGNFVAMRSNGCPPADPNAHCAACGRLGTAGRVIRRIDDVESDHVQLCAQCWAAESHRLDVQWQREAEHQTRAWMHGIRPGVMTQPAQPPSMSTSFETATWDNALQFLIPLVPTIESSDPPTREELRGWALELREQAPSMIGPMPPIVEWFIATYAE